MSRCSGSVKLKPDMNCLTAAASLRILGKLNIGEAGQRHRREGDFAKVVVRDLAVWLWLVSPDRQQRPPACLDHSLLSRSQQRLARNFFAVSLHRGLHGALGLNAPPCGKFVRHADLAIDCKRCLRPCPDRCARQDAPPELRAGAAPRSPAPGRAAPARPARFFASCGGKNSILENAAISSCTIFGSRACRSARQHIAIHFTGEHDVLVDSPRVS